MRNLLICDVDGTVANDTWRGLFDLDRASEDPAYTAMCNMLHALHAQAWDIQWLTSRNERWRQVTMHWLTKHCPVGSALHMRPDDNWMPAIELKIQSMDTIIKTIPVLANTTIMAIDSRDDVCAVYRAAGIYTLQAGLKL